MGDLRSDIRDAVRSFRRDRAYPVVVLLTLGLTIGATTAVFSIVNGVLLRPLAYPASDRLVAIREVWREFSGRFPSLEVNGRHFEHWQAHARSLESMAQYAFVPANLTGAGEAAAVNVVQCSGSLFDVLQVTAALGRVLRPADAAEGAGDVAVIADALWRRRFHADSGILGRSIVLDGRPYSVVGVLPRDFRLPQGDRLTGAIDAIVPLRVTVGWVGDHNNHAIGRLRDGTTLDAATAELAVLQRQVSEFASKEAHEPVTLAISLAPLAEHIVGRSRRALLVLLGAVASVLLIACSNLANLSLTRTAGRLRETAIRMALGATRARVVRRLLLEQLMLAVAGGLLGLWVASMALAVFVRTAPIDLPRLDEVHIDVEALAFAAAVSVLAGLLVTAIPAWRLAGGDVQPTLRSGVPGAGAVRGFRSHAVLLAVQVGLSVTLLVATALFAASFARLLDIDLGFSPARVLAVEASLPAARYADKASREAAYDRLLTAIRDLPAVEAVSTTSLLPLAGVGQVNLIAPEGSRTRMSELPSANFRFVGPEFFRTLGMAVRRGRSFTDAERDPARPAPALVSEPVAARLWPGEDPIGRRFSRGFPGEQNFEVVGVVDDARLASLDQAPPLMVYVPYWWRSRTSMSLLIRTAGDPRSLMADARRAVHRIDPEIAVGPARPLQNLVDDAVAGRRYQARLFTAFGAAALFIAIVGVYAVTSYGVSRRKREMNIRAALGAPPSDVLGLVVRQGAMPVLAGVGAGALGAWAVGGVLAGLLFEVAPRDPLFIAGVSAFVGTAGLLTCATAARRSLSIDPAAALRED